MSIQSVPGSVFAPENPAANDASVLHDNTATGYGAYTTGQVRVADMVTSPTQAHPWTVYGWSIRARVATIKALSATNDHQLWGRFGKLLAGLTINASLPKNQAAILPSDPSTFTEVWDPNEEIAPVLGGPSVNELVYKPIASTFMFPNPVTVQAGSQLQFALIMTPSLLGMTPGVVNAGPTVRSCSFTLLVNG